MRVTKEKKALVFELWIYLNSKAVKNKNSEIFHVIAHPERSEVLVLKTEYESLSEIELKKYLDFLTQHSRHADVYREYISAENKKKFFAFYGINSVNGTHIKRR